jgi:hypothetical protein
MIKIYVFASGSRPSNVEVVVPRFFCLLNDVSDCQVTVILTLGRNKNGILHKFQSKKMSDIDQESQEDSDNESTESSDAWSYGSYDGPPEHSTNGSVRLQHAIKKQIDNATPKFIDAIHNRTLPEELELATGYLPARSLLNTAMLTALQHITKVDEILYAFDNFAQFGESPIVTVVKLWHLKTDAEALKLGKGFHERKIFPTNFNEMISVLEELDLLGRYMMVYYSVVGPFPPKYKEYLKDMQLEYANLVEFRLNLLASGKFPTTFLAQFA